MKNSENNHGLWASCSNLVLLLSSWRTWRIIRYSIPCPSTFFFIYFWDRERQSMNGGGAEREGDTESETGSRLHFHTLKKTFGDTWVAQSVKRPTSAQVMISQFLSLSPTLGSVLPAQSPEPPSDSVSPSLSAPPPLVLCLCLKNK